MLNISKEMVVNYQVGENELNKKANDAYALLITDSSVLQIIEKEIDSKFTEVSEDKTRIETAARALLTRNLSIDANSISEKQLAAAKNLVMDMERRKIIDSMVPKIVKNHLIGNAAELELTPKTRHDIGTTHDFAFLGAAGSGKSTIAQFHVSDGPDPGPEPKKIDKNDCVILATDNYRVFTMPKTEAHEAIETKDVFIRTQDFAYMVKELVQKEIEQGQGKSTKV